MARISETVHESSLTLANNDETVYVAVEKDIDKSKMTLTWALNNFHGKKFCILHVQQLAKVIALIGGNSPESRLEEHEDRTIRELYTKIMEKILDEYILMCEQAGVYAEKLHIEMDDIGEGIVELVYQHSIKKLVIGAAADEHYSGGHLICSGKGALDGADDEDRYGSLQSISFSEMGSSHPSTSASGSSNLRFCDESESELEVLELPRFLELEQLSSSHELEGSSDNQLLDQLEQVMDEAEKLKREAFEESIRRGKAEKAVIEATRKTAVDLSQAYEKERDKFREELDNAIDVTNDLLTRQSEASSSSRIINTQQFFSVFSLSEIHEATSSFDQSLLIWEHGYGTMYKGTLRYTQVAIKMLNPGGASVFQEEVDVLSKFRHPNLITLIGVCPEEYGLIYEYLPNGSLRDRLSCKDNTPPLSWQTRICIATELCSALIFLHSSNPHSIVHGDLKAENIFLDAGFVSKLSGFGISNHPEYLETGELSPKSDIYSFGIIILQLLTGKSRANIVETMQEILDMGNLNALLDSSAGDWPFVQAQQVAHLALRCCDSDPSNRPDLVSEVWRVLKPLSASGGASSSFRMDSEEDSQSPSYFICPILQDVMQEPVVAADGYTYEEEALRGWLDSGHDTSPMTNLRLSHTNLVPNRALRSAIQEWLQHPS
ncbi:hypothetical protein Q3G72_010928 [Acer saccharum]|nr:hypothetical protein Q3G72_010928 [Acer saccharum]